MWLDDCRIPFVDEVMDFDKLLPTQDGGTIYGGGKGFYRTEPIKEYNQQGRFTPNLLVCDDMLNDGVITKQSKRYYNVGTGGQGFYGVKSNGIPQQGDSGSSSRYYDLDKWFDNIIDSL
jgi:hypothetical protein